MRLRRLNCSARTFLFPFKESLHVALPEKRSCDYAYALRITRRNILH